MPAAIQIRPSTFAVTSRLHHVYPITAMPHKGDSKCAAQRPSRFLMKKYPMTVTCSMRNAESAPKFTNRDMVSVPSLPNVSTSTSVRDPTNREAT